MSSAGKFASITASLLARKGEARPWTDPGKKSLAWQDQPMAATPAPMPSPVPAPAPMPPLKAANLPQPSSARPLPKGAPQKKCAVRMSPEEYEMLGILAVKKDCTRQQLLRDAVAQLMNGMAAEYRNQCSCLGSCGGTAWPCSGTNS